MRFYQLLPLYAVVAIGFMGYALTLTLYLPLLFSLHLTAAWRAVLSGSVLAMYPLGQFLGAPVLGSLSDYYGHKKILSSSLILCSMGFLLISYAILKKSLILLFIASFLTGLFEANLALSQSIIADLYASDAHKKLKYISYLYSACSVGYICGPLFGSFCVKFLGFLGYSAPFLIVSLLIMLLFFTIFYAPYFNNNINKNNNININFKFLFSFNILNFFNFFNDSKIIKIYLINFLIFFAVQGLYRVTPIYVIAQWHPTITRYANLIAYVSLLCMIANFLILPRLSHYLSTIKLLILLSLLSALSTISIILFRNFNVIYLTYGVAVIFTVMLFPICATWLSKTVDITQQGEVLGKNQSLMVLGEAAAASIGGLVAAINVKLPILLISLIFILIGLILIILKKINK